MLAMIMMVPVYEGWCAARRSVQCFDQSLGRPCTHRGTSCVARPCQRTSRRDNASPNSSEMQFGNLEIHGLLRGGRTRYARCFAWLDVGLHAGESGHSPGEFM